MSSAGRRGRDHRQGRPRLSGGRASVRLLWIAFAIALAATLVAQGFVHMHPQFRFEGWFGFYAAYGFGTCIGMVLIARLLGAGLKRPDDYYNAGRDRRAAGERRND